MRAATGRSGSRLCERATCGCAGARSASALRGSAGCCGGGGRVVPGLGAGRRGWRATAGAPRLFRYRRDDELFTLGALRLNEYIQEYMGEEFSAKDFRTWGGTLLAA